MPLQSQVIPICVTQNSCFFGTFLEKILFLTHFDQSNPPHDRHIRKAVHLRIPKIRLKFDFRHPMERQIFGDGGGLDPALILALCHMWRKNDKYEVWWPLAIPKGSPTIKKSLFIWALPKKPLDPPPRTQTGTLWHLLSGKIMQMPVCTWTFLQVPQTILARV